MRDVPPDLLKRFFIRTPAGYQISKAVRDVCVFARQNVAADPPFSGLDLLSCRNKLTSFGPDLQLLDNPADADLVVQVTAQTQTAVTRADAFHTTRPRASTWLARRAKSRST